MQRNKANMNHWFPNSHTERSFLFDMRNKSIDCILNTCSKNNIPTYVSSTICNFSNVKENNDYRNKIFFFLKKFNKV